MGTTFDHENCTQHTQLLPLIEHILAEYGIQLIFLPFGLPFEIFKIKCCISKILWIENDIIEKKKNVTECTEIKNILEILYKYNKYKMQYIRK